ncbi:Type I Iterative PKS [Gnomoniopsis sp. IMI 355080]|nr:Type I Iterative PKS [Gnomoniopsis sp. IMI 355080]
MAKSGRDVPIAIVGLSCRLPGGANDTGKLWDVLTGGKETWTPTPADRFNENAFYHPSGDDPNGTNNHPGGHFIDGDVRDFDHAFFRLSPPQAAAMDPQIRILLEVTYEALENSGMTLEACSGSSTAVFTPTFTSDFDRNLYKDPLNLPTYYLTGTEEAVVSNRISLNQGESSAAIVAASNLTLAPDHHIGMSGLHLISDTGRSYPFDSRGTGYGRGEGCVVFVLKRLEDAIADRDSIRAVFRSTAVNQDGYTASGITYPNSSAQERLIVAALKRAGLGPQDIHYVEAHGTGTQAGDRQELTALSMVFPNHGRGQGQPLHVGSIKGNIGHTENVSGLASLVKAVLILHHLQIPPTAGLVEYKPDLPLNGMVIPTELLPWPQRMDDNDGHSPPRISINSFGFGGTNAVAIIERFLTPHKRPSSLDLPHIDNPHLFVLSANSKASLAAMITSYYDWLKQQPRAPLMDLSYTLCSRRSALLWRHSCVATDQESLLAALYQDVRNSSLLQHSANGQLHISFVFTGQGAQWAGMGRELLSSQTPHSKFRDSIQSSSRILSDLGATWDLEEELLHADSTRINTAEIAQPATTAVQIALVEMLRSFGIKPTAVVGHSSGEIAAAYTAGHIDIRQALLVSYHRGFMAATANSQGLPRGAMLSVGLGEEEALPYTKGLSKGKACLACINSPQSVTISGDADAIDEVASRLEAARSQNGATIFHRRLLVDTAYHSHHMRAIGGSYRSCLAGMGHEKGDERTNIAFFSSVSGGLKLLDFGAEYWVSNLVSPVRFSDALQQLARCHIDGQDHVYVEIGPHSALAGPVRQTLTKLDGLDKPKPFNYLSVLQRKRSAVYSTLALIGKLFERGASIDMDASLSLCPGADKANVITNLPTYPWDHSTKHWYESRISREYRMRRNPYHDLLGVRSAEATTIEPRWRHMISLNTLPWLAHHIIDHQAVFPGSGYLCMAIEALRQIAQERHPQRSLTQVILRDVSFIRALVVPDTPERVEMQISLKPCPNTLLGFTFSIAAYVDEKWHEHCAGQVEGLISQGYDDLLDSQPGEMSAPEDLAPQQVTSPLDLSAEDIYRELAADGNQYGTTFKGIKRLKLGTGAKNSVAWIEIPDTAAIMPKQHQEPHLVHPTTLDVMIHSAIPCVVRNIGKGSIMPVRIGELVLSAKGDVPWMARSQLQVVTRVMSCRSSVANVDMEVTAGETSLIDISGIVLRSLASQSSALEENNTPGICYELDWRSDVANVRVDDLSPAPRIAELVEHIIFKLGAELSVLAIGAGELNISSVFLRALDNHNLTVPTYDIVDESSAMLEKARKRLLGYPVRYHTFGSSSGASDQEGPQSRTYDVVLVSSTESLLQASRAVKENGFVLLDLKDATKIASHEHDLIRGALLDIQISFIDTTRDALIVVARPCLPVETTTPNIAISILTQSPTQAIPLWVNMLEAGLQSLSAKVTCNVLSTNTVGSTADDDWVIVVEDGFRPILSDSCQFDAAVTLLKRSGRVLWLATDDPRMYQITGVARTAHAENDNLSLVTMHVAPEMLQLDTNRLLEVIKRLITVSTRLNAPQLLEREYKIDARGTVRVPRLLKSLSLNRAVGKQDDEFPAVMSRPFLNPTRALSLSSTNYRQNQHTTDPAWVEQNGTKVVDLEGPEAIQLQVRAVTFPKSGTSALYNEYAGVVTAVGAAVRGIAPGNHIFALGPPSSLGANTLRIDSANAGRLPEDFPFSVGAAMLVDTLAALYALHGLAHLTAHQTVLIHGALSSVGRAALAVCRWIGAVVTLCAANVSEAQRMEDELAMPSSQVLILRRLSLSQKVPDHKFDVILQTSSEQVPAPVDLPLKPFGSLVIIHADDASATHDRPTQSPFKLPKNASIFYCNIEDVLRERPELIAGLIIQARPAMEELASLMLGLDICVRDVSQLKQARHLAERRDCDKIVLVAGHESLVPVVIAPCPTLDVKWGNKNASYVVSGGLGDLGRRLLYLMARRGARYLVTLSRKDADPAEHGRLQAGLHKVHADCTLICVTCDITSRASVCEAAAALVKQGVPPVRGVIQSAAVIHDRTLETMNHDEFLTASKVKIDGTFNLEQAFASSHLDFFIMLSSAANIIGNSGQASYNAGNAVQDAIAQSRKDSGCRFLSLDIGWIEDAQLTVDDETRLSNIRRAGLRAIHPDEMERYFDFALEDVNTNRQPQAIIGFDSSSLANATTHNGTVHSALFCHVRGLNLSAAALTGQPSSNVNLVSFAEALSCGNREVAIDLAAAGITGHLARLISVDTRLIDPREGSILALGLDSLVSIELRNWIMREYSAPLQSAEILTDQTIHALAEKVVSRVRVSSGIANQKAKDGTDSMANGVSPRDGETTADTGKDVALPELPLPQLEDVLRQFEDSRRAVDSAEQQQATSNAIDKFLQGPGPHLQQRVANMLPEDVASAYERHFWLKSREPLQDYCQFVIAHPSDAPRHSQAGRATILTLAAFEYARNMTAGRVPTDHLHGAPLNSEARRWLFYATRRPRCDEDYMVSHAANQTIIVLRRGHIFKMSLPQPNEALDALSIYNAYTAILSASNERFVCVSSLTADDRESWATARSELESEASNAALLAVIDSCAFVVCLDDEAPQTAGERHVQFFENGLINPLSNRWQDKPMQIAVTANGFSAGIYNHTKLDGLDAAWLHIHMTRFLFSQQSREIDVTCRGPVSSKSIGSKDPVAVCHLEELQWTLSSHPTIPLRVKQVQKRLKESWAQSLEHLSFHTPSLGLISQTTHKHRVPPNSAAQLSVLLALYMVDGEIRPVWENASLGRFKFGRVDWVQTMTPAARTFIEAAARGVEDVAHLRSLFEVAAVTHARLMTGASQGHGYLRHMYALVEALEQEKLSVDCKPATNGDKSLDERPALFTCRAWIQSCQWGQHAQVGFMPELIATNDDKSGDISERLWDEGGMLKSGDRGIYVHSGVRKDHVRFTISAKPRYADAVSKALHSAVDIISSLLA